MWLIMLLIQFQDYYDAAKSFIWLWYVVLIDWNMGACLYGYQLLKSRIAALFVAGASRVFLICFGVHYWFVR